MPQNKKTIELANRIIMLGWSMAVGGACIAFYHGVFLQSDNKPQFPIWIVFIFIIASAVVLSGMFLLIMGIGVPLTSERYFSLILGYPQRIEESTAELAAKYEVHPTMITTWKRELTEGAAELFDKGQKTKNQHDNTVDELNRQIGQLKVENNFLAKGLGR